MLLELKENGLLSGNESNSNKRRMDDGDISHNPTDTAEFEV